MSRGFFGKSGGGKKTSSSMSRGNSRLTRMLQDGSSLDRDKIVDGIKNVRQKDHRDMLQDLIDEKMFSAAKPRGGSTLSGVKAAEEREMSKGMKQALASMMQKKMKKRKGQGKVVIKPKSFGMGESGGRITESGTIMNNAGQILMRIDPETGIITDGFGLKVGKYNPNSAVCDTKIEKLIAKYTKAKSTLNPFAPKS